MPFQRALIAVASPVVGVQVRFSFTATSMGSQRVRFTATVVGGGSAAADALELGIMVNPKQSAVRFDSRPQIADHRQRSGKALSLGTI